MNDDQRRAAGLAIRRAMFGAAGAEDAVANASEFTRPLHDYLSRYCFGEFWECPEFGRRDRSLLTLAMLVALGREQEVRMHTRGAIANGVTVDELRGLALHAMPYCGVPASVGAFRAMDETLRDMGLIA